MDIDSHEETLLIEKARRGDKDAFAALVSLHERKIFSLSMRMLGNYDDASDVTQDVFFQAYRNIRSFKNRSSLYTWLYRITINKCYKFYKKKHKKPLLYRRPGGMIEEDIRPADVYENIPSASDSPIEEAEADEERELVRQAMKELHNKLYQIVVLRDVEGMSYSDIAGLLHISEGTVMSRLHRAHEALSKNLKKLGII